MASPDTRPDQTRTAPPVVDPLFELSDDAEEIAHLVCCRDVSWRRAFCGEENDRLLTTVTVLCTMCVEVTDRMLPGWGSADPPSCPVDGRPCPPEEELDAEYERRSR